MISKKLRRWAGLAAGIVVAMGVPVAGASAAQDIEVPPPLPWFITREVGVSPDNDLGPARTARAQCPPGTDVVGGGGEGVLPDAGHPNELILTGLVPDAATNQYVVTVTDVSAGGPDDEWVAVAYAICVEGIQDHALTSVPTPVSPNPVQNIGAPCTGRQVIGTGARIAAQEREGVGLQTVRLLPAGNEVRASAVDTNGGVVAPWNLTSHASCAEPNAKYQSVAVTGPARRFLTRATCSTGFVHGGGAQLNNAPPDVVISRIRPSSDLLTVEVKALKVSETPSDVDWTLTAQAICDTAMQN